MNALFSALVLAHVTGAILSVPVAALVWLALRCAPSRALNAATRCVIWWATLAVVIALPAMYLPLPRPHTAASRTEYVLDPPPIQVIQPHRALPIVKQPSPAPRLRFPVEIPSGSWLKWIASSWMLLTALLLVRLIASYVSLGRCKSRATDAPSQLLESWLVRSGCKREGIRLLISKEISTPIAAGPARPSILIPARLLDELHADELDQVGLHETAHLARRDDYALLVQRIVEAVFALHPVVRFLTRQIDLDREIACDDFVVQTIGRPRPYAACLARMAEMSSGVSNPVVAAAAMEEGSHLTRRVEMLLDKTRHTGTRVLRARLTVMVFVLVAIAWTTARAPALIAFAKPVAKPVSVAPAPAPVQPSVSSDVPATPAAESRPLPLIAQAALPNRPAADPSEPAMVMVPVIVTESRGRIVTNLEKKNFRIFEDGIEQKISQFSAQDVPISLGIVFSVGDGPNNKIEVLRQGVSRILQTSNPQDEFFLVQPGVNGAVVEVPWTQDTEQIRSRLTLVPPSEHPALSDVVYPAVTYMKNAHNSRREILVMSDGPDAGGLYSQADIVDAVRATDLQIYTMRISAVGSLTGKDETESMPLFMFSYTQLREDRFSGRNRDFIITMDLPDAMAKISLQMRNHYILGFTPMNPSHDGKYHQISVSTADVNQLPPLTVKARSGYYAPTQ